MSKANVNDRTNLDFSKIKASRNLEFGDPFETPVGLTVRASNAWPTRPPGMFGQPQKRATCGEDFGNDTDQKVHTLHGMG